MTTLAERLVRLAQFQAKQRPCPRGTRPLICRCRWAQACSFAEEGDERGDLHDVYGEGPDAAIRDAAQFPINDPTLLVSGMAAVTEHLGFGVTSSLT